MSVLAPDAPQAPSTRAVDALLAQVRRRLRVAWLVATGSYLAPIVAGIALVLMILARLRPWRWPEPAALGIVVAAALALILRAATIRLSDSAVARAADRGLDSDDVLATALEFRTGSGPLVDETQRRAETLAEGRTAADAVTYQLDGTRVAIAVALFAAAIGAAVAANPQDRIRADAAEARSILAEEADALTAAATEIGEQPSLPGEQPTTGEDLLALAEQLRAMDDLEDGAELLEQASARLAERVGENLLAQRAAAVGLDRSLANQPLTDAGAGSAADQLEAAADQLDELDDDDLADLAKRLDSLADTQVTGNPAAADALREAAAAVSAGNQVAAAGALDAAAGAQRSSGEAIEAQEDARQAARAATDTGQRLRDRATTQGQDQPAGEPGTDAEGGADGGEGGDGGDGGEGEAGEGQTGEGQTGEGQGSSGQGGSGSAGGGGGTGGAAPDGQLGGTSSGSGPVSGDGNGSNGDASQNANRESAQEGNDPNRAGATEQVVVSPGTGADVDGETVGEVDGPTAVGAALVPLDVAVRSYEARAARTLDQTPIPPSQRALVQSYFDHLAEG